VGNKNIFNLELMFKKTVYGEQEIRFKIQNKRIRNKIKNGQQKSGTEQFKNNRISILISKIRITFLTS
jgi:hypothetical protein